ncbi:MAG: hypothetical protein O9340_10475 [Cyclobacteriaceae bacterium]|jgi:hypothetical protein|nr:hypothetical protein [Cyclobacteriaceae bacterium]
MFNKRKKAIEAFEKHLADLSMISNVRDGNNWKASLKDTLNLYIGAESSISKRLDGLYFTRREDNYHSRDLGTLTKHIFDNSKKDNFRDLIQNAIKYVEANGIYKNEFRRNFLGDLNNREIIGGIVGATIIILGIGNYFGKLEKDREVFQFEKQKDELEKEILKLSERVKKSSSDSVLLKQAQQEITSNKNLIDSLQNEIYKTMQKGKVTKKANNN